MTKEIICVACPMGCGMTVEEAGGEVLSVAGNGCKRGLAYAQSECKNPARSLTGTVSVTGGGAPLVPVKSAGPVPKALLIDCARALKTISVPAPLAIGDVVAANILGTGIDMLATNHVAAL
jgi:CxxC motif-containing protein